MKLFVGIDPGLYGAVAGISQEGELLFAWDTPIIEVVRGKTPKGNPKKRHMYLPSKMADTLRDDIKVTTRSTMVGLESVHAMPGQGVTSMFSMGRGLGIWEGIVATLGFPIEMIEPSKWKREMGIIAGSDKSASIETALRLFPSAPIKLKRDNGRADALLLAEWLRRRHCRG